MSESLKWIEHKGKRILFCDFSNFSEEEYLQGTEDMEKELIAQGKGSFTLLLIDVKDSHMSQVTSDRGKKTIEILTPLNITTKTSMIGISGVKRIIAQAISRDVHFDKDLESAKDWLVEEN
jgi:hypothetical protein